MKLTEAEQQFQYELLQGVARTFALTIPQLPATLAPVVANAYLLCRIADTIEDEQGIAAERKRELSESFILVVKNKYPAEKLVDALHPLLSEQRLPAEKELIRQISKVVAITHRFNSTQRDSLERCVQVMSEGMAYFQANAGARGMLNLGRFNSYCYHVAGVVGEMLTELYCDYSPEMANNKDQLMVLAVSFGQGLQMVNILKDIWEDLERGICWLPRDVFFDFGYDLDNLQEHRFEKSFGDGLARMIAIAHAHLQNAMQYTLIIPKQNKDLRKFCLWAIGMALLTLRKIYRKPDFSSGQQVKISKRSVLGVVLLANMAKRSDTALKWLFKLAGSALPAPVNASTSNSHEHIREWFNARSEL